MFDEPNALLKNCKECAELHIEKEIASNKEKDGEIPKSRENYHDPPKEARISKTVQKTK